MNECRQCFSTLPLPPSYSQAQHVLEVTTLMTQRDSQWYGRERKSVAYQNIYGLKFNNTPPSPPAHIDAHIAGDSKTATLTLWKEKKGNTCWLPPWRHPAHLGQSQAEPGEQPEKERAGSPRLCSFSSTHTQGA